MLGVVGGYDVFGPGALNDDPMFTCTR